MGQDKQDEICVCAGFESCFRIAPVAPREDGDRRGGPSQPPYGDEPEGLSGPPSPLAWGFSGLSHPGPPLVLPSLAREDA